MNRLRKASSSLLGMAVLCLAASPAGAEQLVTGFEPPAYVGSASGTVLTGQQGWYAPVVAGSTTLNYSVFTYAGNTLGLPANPAGQSQFIGATGAGGTSFPRAQHNIDFSSASVWTVSYDVAHRFNGTLPAAQALGSFSLQSATGEPARQFIALHNWSNLATATNWNSVFNVFNAAGVATDNLSPGPAWNNLLVDNWYRESITFDLSTNLITSVSITNLTTGVTNTASPTGWYLTGGANPTQPLPSAIRFFTGGNVVAGNVAGWDNLSIQGAAVPEPSAFALLALGSLGLAAYACRRRRPA